MMVSSASQAPQTAPSVCVNRAASPHLTTGSKNGPSDATWRRLEQSDVSFARAIEAADSRIDDAIREEIFRRAMFGTEDLQVQGGRIVTREVVDPETGETKRVPVVKMKVSDDLLKTMARAKLPEFADKKTIDVNIHDGRRGGLWEISSDDVAALTQDQRDDLHKIMLAVRTHRRGLAAPVIEVEEVDYVAQIESEIAHGE